MIMRRMLLPSFRCGTWQYYNQILPIVILRRVTAPQLQ
jgi:hypothetical protein